MICLSSSRLGGGPWKTGPGCCDARTTEPWPEVNSSMDEPMAATTTMATSSRTHQYRKVMKPLLERKRRARINKCLDDLKDIMVNTLQAEGESITKLEKADVLELTVKHLRRLKRHNALGLTPQATYAGRFRSGYSRCAQEVSAFMTSSCGKGVDAHISARLLSHLSGCIHALEAMPPSVLPGGLPISQAFMTVTSVDRQPAVDPCGGTFPSRGPFPTTPLTPPSSAPGVDPGAWRPW